MLLKNKFTRIFLVLFCLFIVSFGVGVIYTPSVSAQSISRLDSRIDRLRFRLRKLEAQVRRLSQSNPRAASPSPDVGRSSQFEDPPIVDDDPIDPNDPLFKRLATLVIEIKDDINKIEARLDNLEQKNASVDSEGS